MKKLPPRAGKTYFFRYCLNPFSKSKPSPTETVSSEPKEGASSTSVPARLGVVANEYESLRTPMGSKKSTATCEHERCRAGGGWLDKRFEDAAEMPRHGRSLIERRRAAGGERSDGEEWA